MEAAAGARLRARRRELGLSLRELGSRVGVSASMLSQVENGRCRPSVATLYRLVGELGLSLDDVFEQAPTSAPVVVDSAPRRRAPAAPRATATGPVRHPGDRVTIELESGVTWEKLSDSAPPGLEFILVTYQPGSSSGKSGKFSQHEGFECAYVQSGELTFHHMFDTWTLRAGDTVTFDASEPHRLENLGDQDVRALWVVYRDESGASGAAGAAGLRAAVGDGRDRPRTSVVRGS